GGLAWLVGGGTKPASHPPGCPAGGGGVDLPRAATRLGERVHRPPAARGAPRRTPRAGEEEPTCATPGTVPLSDSADTAVMRDARTPAVPTDARVASAMAYPAPHSPAVVEVLRHGRPDPLIPETSIVPSHAARWDGLALESFPDLPPLAIPDHEHPTHFLGLLLGAAVETEWTT